MDKNQYQQFVLSGIDKPVDPFKNTYAGFLLGSAQFIKEKLQSLRDQVESKEIAYRDNISEGIDIELITQEVGVDIIKKPENCTLPRKSRFSPGRSLSTWRKTHLLE